MPSGGKDPNEGFRPVKVRWLKTVEGISIYTGIAEIVEGETAILDPSEAGRAISKGLAVVVETDKPESGPKPRRAPKLAPVETGAGGEV